MISDGEDYYWKYITSENVLRRAAHLVAKDSQNDFHDSYIERQVFSHSRDQIIKELIGSLNSNRYMPAPANPISIPKSAYSQRPGVIMPYRDRVLLQAIIMCLAPNLDALLSPSVWSWRVKRKLVGQSPDRINSRGLFRESDISEFPFLKRKTVSKYIDEFEPWYALWPRFDNATRRALREEKFQFLVFSDISAYFENIQLTLMHNLLHRNAPNAPNTINLLMRHLRAWCQPAHDGSQTARGIPQGNAISSFLGNFFLKPIDDHFNRNYSTDQIRYFRYMDDIRIVAIDAEAARKAALDLEVQIRRLQLNLQSAKTKILDAKSAVAEIHDRRLDQLQAAEKLVRRGLSKQAALPILEEIARDQGDSAKARSIRKSQPPLEGLNLRVLRRWSSLHFRLGTTVPQTRLCREALANPSYAMSREIRRIASSNPRSKPVPLNVWMHLLRGAALFEYQEAEFLRGLRLFSWLPPEGIDYAHKKVMSDDCDPYLRLQAAVLLCRYPGVWPHAADVVEVCLGSADLRVISAGVLVASLDSPEAMARHIRTASSHASHDTNRLIEFIRSLRAQHNPRRKLLNYIFQDRGAQSNLLFEYSPFLRFMASGSRQSSEDLRGALRTRLRVRALAKSERGFLTFLLTQCEENLKRVGSVGAASNDNEEA